MSEQATKSWDSPENEALNAFLSWGKPGDFVLGTLTEVKQVKSTLPDKAGEMQNIYTVKVKECSYHLLDEKKNPIEPPEILEEGDIVSVGGRKSIDSRMARVKLGQVFGLKFIEELPAKTKGYNPTKAIKVFTPKGADGEYEMDQAWLEKRKAEENGDGF